MSPETPPETPLQSEELLVPVAIPPRAPVYGWQDVALFFGLGLPLIVFSQVILGLIAKGMHLSVANPIVAIAAQGIAYVLLFTLLAFILRVQYEAPFWKSLGWGPSRIPVASSLALGIALAFGLAILGGLLRIPDVDSPVTKMLASRDSAAILVFFGVLVAPLAEELAFRGFLQPLIVRSFGAIAGICLTALLFGMLHWEQNSKSWWHVGIISLAGVAFGVLRHLSGSTKTSTLAHVAYNSTLFLAYFAYGRKSSI